MSGGGPLKIFVIGCGRSGTHWLGHTLASHPDIVTQIEVQPAFGMVFEMAWDPSVERTRLEELVRIYEAAHERVLPKHFADKSHPALWFAEALAERFAEARFISIRRRILPTVGSMLHHSGVLRHHERWRKTPELNRFLGVTDVGAYQALSNELRCALRVIVSSNEIDRLATQSKCRLHAIEYEEMQADPTREARRLATFLEVSDAFAPPPPRAASLSKWRETLNSKQIDEITTFADGLGALHRL